MVKEARAASSGGAYQSGRAGTGGIGVVGGDLTIINKGTIEGALLSGTSDPYAPSIYFTGGDNTLTLSSGSVLTGDILLGGKLKFNQTDDVVLKYGIVSSALGIETPAGSVVQDGTGSLTIAGASSYSGGTLVIQGRLALAHETAGMIDAAGTSGIDLGGGQLELAATGTLPGRLTIREDAVTTLGVRDGYSAIFNGPLTLGARSTTTFGATGDGGNLLLAGSAPTIAPTSKIVIAGGHLQAGEESSVLGQLTAQAASVTLNGGTLDFNGNSATIGTLLGTGGTLTSAQIAKITLQGGTFSGTITGGTALEIRGSVALSGANTYSGGTFLRSGTLAVGSSTALGSETPLSMDENTTLAFAANHLSLDNPITFTKADDPKIDTGLNDATLSGVIAGPGALTKTGTGSLTLDAINIYTGDTTVAAGSLVVDGSIAQSSVFVESGAVLGGSGTVGSLTAKSGSFVQPGPGSAFQTLNVAGDVTFLGGSTFRVKINPTGQTDSLVATGTATLGGATLSVNEAPGTYTNILSPFTILSAKSVQGQFGQVVSANAAGFAFVDPTVVYGPQTVTLTFVRNDTPLPGVALTPNQAGPAGAIQNSAPPAPPTNNTTSPEPAPGPGPKRPRGNPGPDTPPSPVPSSIPQVLYNAVLGQTPAGAQQAYRALAGTVYASQTASTIQASRYVSVNVLDRLFSIAGSGLDARQLLDQLSPNTLPTFINCFAPLPSAEKLVPQNVTFWGDGFGSFGKTSGNANAAGLDHALGGFILGADAPLHGFSAPYRVGLAGGYTNDSFSSRGGGASGTAESYFGSLYGSARYGSIDVRLGTSAAAIQTTADRTVAFPGFLEKEHGRYWGNVVQGFGEVGYRFATSRYVIEPVIDAAVVHIHQDGFRESGGAAALIGYAQDVTTASTTLGVRGEAALINGLPLIARTFVGWRHGYGDINPAATFAFASGSTPFSSTGAPIDRDALAAEAGLDWRASSRLTLGASYVGQIGARDIDNAVRGRLEYKF